MRSERGLAVSAAFSKKTTAARATSCCRDRAPLLRKMDSNMSHSSTFTPAPFATFSSMKGGWSDYDREDDWWLPASDLSAAVRLAIKRQIPSAADRRNSRVHDGNDFVSFTFKLRKCRDVKIGPVTPLEIIITTVEHHDLKGITPTPFRRSDLTDKAKIAEVVAFISEKIGDHLDNVIV